jgi:uncharacterized RDD family membrane protein YckC
MPEQPQQPAQSWQSPPQQPAPPPPAGGMAPGSGSPEWMANLTSQQPVAGPAGYFYADVPNRVIAMVIDVVAAIVVFVIIGIVTLGIFGENIGFGISVPTTASLLVQAIISYAIWAAYFIYTWVNMRGTLGMRALGLQVGHETDGRSLTYEQGAFRFAVLFGPQIVLGLLGSLVISLSFLNLFSFVWLIYVLVTIAQSPTKQGIHDKYAHSMVVKAGRSVSS